MNSLCVSKHVRVVVPANSFNLHEACHGLSAASDDREYRGKSECGPDCFPRAKVELYGNSAHRRSLDFAN